MVRGFCTRHWNNRQESCTSLSGCDSIHAKWAATQRPQGGGCEAQDGHPQENSSAGGGDRGRRSGRGEYTTAVSAAAATAPASTSYTGTLANGTTWIADVPAEWNGTLLLYRHGFGPLTAADAPDPARTPRCSPRLRARSLLLRPERLGDRHRHRRQRQLGTLAAVESTVLARPGPTRSRSAPRSAGWSARSRRSGPRARSTAALTTCGIVGGGVNLNECRIDGEYTIARLLGGTRSPRLRRVRCTPRPRSAPARRCSRTPPTARTDRGGRARPAWRSRALLDPVAVIDILAAPSRSATRRRRRPARSERDVRRLVRRHRLHELGRVSVDQADSGQRDLGCRDDFAASAAGWRVKTEVEALCTAADLNLNADLADAHRAHRDDTADPAALRSLVPTSVPTGRLAVPELDLALGRRQPRPGPERDSTGTWCRPRGGGGLLRQAYTEASGTATARPARRRRRRRSCTGSPPGARRRRDGRGLAQAAEPP